MKKVGMKQIIIKVGRSTDIPLDDDSVDVVASNGIYNLTSDKKAVMSEVFRVLKTGDRTVFCEIMLTESLPKAVRKNINDWFRCIGGALPEKEFIALMRNVGFERIKIISKVRNARTGHESSICANILAYKPY
jgi:hypothetical protein